MSNTQETFFIKEQIEGIKIKCEKIKPLVVIRCITYNHGQYIRNALESFVTQKTKFPLVVIVHDDTSTDETTTIINEYAEKYPNIILPIIEKENQYSKGNGSIGKILNPVCISIGAKYMAFCEGDDYWTDPLKLQKQVDFLESNPDFGMCYTKVERLNQAKGKIKDCWGGPNETFESLYVKNTIPTLTVLLRMSLFSEYIRQVNPANKSWRMGDYPIWLYIAAKSKIKFIDEITGVYRVLPESASHSKSIEKTFSFRTNFYKIGEDMVSFMDYPVSSECEIKHKREKFFHVLSLAILLKDDMTIREAEAFFSSNKKSFREYLLLNWKMLMRIMLKVRYAKRGYKISHH